MVPRIGFLAAAMFAAALCSNPNQVEAQTFPTLVPEEENIKPEMDARVLVREAGLTASFDDFEAIQAEVEQFCSTTTAPEVCQRHLVVCAMTKGHPDETEAPLEHFMGLPFTAEEDHPHPYAGLWKDDPALAGWMNASLVRACARDATERWATKRQHQVMYAELDHWMDRQLQWVELRVLRMAPWAIIAGMLWLGFRWWRRRHRHAEGHSH